MIATTDDTTLEEWQRVSSYVATLVPTAFRIKTQHAKTASDLGLLSHSALTWLPERNELRMYVALPVSEQAQDKYKTAMFHDFSPKAFFVLHTATPNWSEEILIKKGAMFPTVGKTWDYANAALGGSRPLSNALVSGLALGGLGYGAGTLMEHLFPERYVERGKLRKTLATTGALGGLAFGANNAYANARAMGKDFWSGWLIPNNATPPYLQPKQAAFEAEDAIGRESGMQTPSIPVDAFNRVVWNDVRPNSNMHNPYGTKSPWGSNEQSMHTPPALAAATTGIMSGLGAMAQSPIISPSHVVYGLASAGVGLATANIAGKALSALAGLTPEAQNKLQDMGLWAGMLHAVVPPLVSQMR